MTQDETERRAESKGMHPVDKQIIVAGIIVLAVLWLGGVYFDMLQWYSACLGFGSGVFFIVFTQMYLGKDDPFRSKPSDEGAGGGA